MIDPNEGDENNEKEGGSSGSDEFDFYFSFTKPLVLELSTEEDRAIAAAWVQKLETEPGGEDKQLRLNYLKLLLFVLQRGRLSGIFKKQPPSGPLQPFPQGFSIIDLGNWMLDQDDAQAFGGGDAARVPYNIEISNDLREFVASQEIPNFGVQMYYAWSSDEPIHKWSCFDEEKFPQYILDKIKQLKQTSSEEKSTILKNGCLVKKKACDMILPDKCSKKKVKSPQEIERQGRSFHTYLGLVGRLGNFNDKCDDDPDKFQRQDPRKGNIPKRNGQKGCPGGEVAGLPGEGEYDDIVGGLGGLTSQNRPCLCPYPCHHPNCPDINPGGGPQPYENPKKPNRNYDINFRADDENAQWTATAYKPSGSRRERDTCADGEISARVPSQVRSPSSRGRSASPVRPPTDCFSDDPLDGYTGPSGVCTCNYPPCTCPCPRGPSNTVRKAPAGANARPTGGRVLADANPTFQKQPKPDPCEYEGNEEGGIGLNPTFPLEDPCAPASGKSDTASMRSRPGVASIGRSEFTSMGNGITPGPCGRSMQPEVIHCYDNQNPDPALTKTLAKNQNVVHCGVDGRFDNTDYKLACKRNQKIMAAQQNILNLSSRRELFERQQQEASRPPAPGHFSRQTPGRVVSPPLESHPVCEYSPPDEMPEEQAVCPQPQNFEDCEGLESPLAFLDCDTPCERLKTDTYKKSSCQASPRLNNSNYSGRPCSPNNNTARVSNTCDVLQNVKQSTESPREKCNMPSPRRTTPNNANFQPCNIQTQTKPFREKLHFYPGEPNVNYFSQPRSKNFRPLPGLYFSPQSQQRQMQTPCPERGYGSVPNSFEYQSNCEPSSQLDETPTLAPSDFALCSADKSLNFRRFLERDYEEDEGDCDSSDSTKCNDNTYVECLTGSSAPGEQNSECGEKKIVWVEPKGTLLRDPVPFKNSDNYRGVDRFQPAKRNPSQRQCPPGTRDFPSQRIRQGRGAQQGLRMNSYERENSNSYTMNSGVPVDSRVQKIFMGGKLTDRSYENRGQGANFEEEFMEFPTENCDSEILNQHVPGNIYMERSLKVRGMVSPPNFVTSTPIKNCKRPPKNQRPENCHPSR